MIEIIGIAGLTFLLRALPGILRIQPGGGDQTYHLLVADEIRARKFKYPGELRGFLMPGLYIYPVFFPYLLSLLPKFARERLAPFYSAIIDTIHVILIYFFALYVLQQTELSSLVLNPSLVATIAALLFATSPALLYIGVGPRAYAATPRILGELFITLTLFSTAIYYWEGIWWAALLSCLFAGLTLITSRFSAQVLLFFSVILAPLLRFPLLLALPILGVICAFMLSKGHYQRVLRGHVKHLIRYHRFQYQFPVIRRNSLSAFKDVLTRAKSRKFRQSANNFLGILNNNTFIILVTRNVMLLLLVYFIILNFSLITSNNTFVFLCSWIAASFIVFIITSLKPLLFLGEAERYIEHSVPAQAILLSFFLISLKDIAPLMAYHFLFYAGTLAFLCVSHRMGLKDRETKQGLFDWFRLQNIHGKKILAFLSGLSFEIAYGTANEVLFPAGDRWLNPKEYEILFEEYPYPNINLKMLIERYGLELIIVNKKVLENARKRGWIYDLSPYAKVFENDFYTVYET